MATLKRKAGLSEKLGRRVRARVEDSVPEEMDASDGAPSEEGFESDPSVTGDEAPSDDESGSEAQSDGPPEEEDASHAIKASQLSFGALAKAQATMASSRDRKAAEDDRPKDKEESGAPWWHAEPPKASAITAPKRSSKHAPQEMTSKRAVSRKREVVAVPKVQARDPRFAPLGASANGLSKLDELKAEKAYAFLNEYRDDEMRQLRAAIKKTKDPTQKEKLQRALMSMESRKKDRDRRERAQAVMDEHRKQEKELVKQGKKPFYLKKSEQKKRVLIDKFASMKKGQVDRAIERRRKKVAGKEKKELPMTRRGFEE